VPIDSPNSVYVNRDKLQFNNKVSWSDRVYKRWDSQSSIESNYAPLVSVSKNARTQSRPTFVPVLDLTAIKVLELK